MTSSLPDTMRSAFLGSEHVCRHHAGIWNSVFLDQFGEQTYIHYGKSKGDLVDKSLSSDAVSEWIFSHHHCNTLTLLMDSLYEEPREYYARISTHKEESERRRRLDTEDRNKIREELKLYMNPVTDYSSSMEELLLKR